MGGREHAPKGDSGGRVSDADRLARGVSRLLGDMGFSVLTEFRLGVPRRVDVVGIDGRGKIVIVEIKCSVADFRADRKWRDYLPYCDTFYFAVPPRFPRDVLPQDTGLIVADAYGGEVVRAARKTAMNGNRRRSLTLALARTAADRLQRLLDEGP